MTVPEPINSEVKQISIDDEMVVRRLEASDVNGRSRHSSDRDVTVAIVSNLDVVVIVDEDSVRGSVAGSIDSKVDVKLGHAAARCIIDVNIIGAAKRVESDLFDAGQVHGDIAEIAREQSTASGLGRESEVFSSGTAVEQHRVEPSATVQSVAAVAGIPDEHVVAPASEHLVDTWSADQGIIAVSARQQVVSAAAQQSVIAISAEKLVIARSSDERVISIVGRGCRVMLN